jgi:lipopolysaccharide export system permease protein
MIRPVKIFDWYILKGHIAPFVFGTTLVIFLFLMQFLINFLDRFVGKGLSIWVILQLITYYLSSMVVLAVPMGVLFSTLMVFGNLSSNSEITVIKASGGSLVSMMKPLFLFGIILTGFLFWFNDYVLPESNHQAKVLMSDITRKKPTFNIEAGEFSTQLTGYTILARKVDSLTGKMSGITIYDNSKFNVANVISADSGYIQPNKSYTKMILTLFDGEVHQSFTNRQNLYRIVYFDESEIMINVEDFLFTRSASDMLSRGDREMHISDMEKVVREIDTNLGQRWGDLKMSLRTHLDYLINGKGDFQKYTSYSYRFADSLTRERLNILKNVELKMDYFYNTINASYNIIHTVQKRKNSYIVEIQKKYAIPFACFVFVLIGCPLGIVIRRGNFGISALLSLGFYIFYWMFLIGGEKLADRDIVSPYTGMWLANVVIGTFGILLTIRVNRESFKLPVFNIHKRK